MSTWSNRELEKIGSAEELQIAALRSDGTLRKSTIIWVVRLGNDLYVRSVNGRTSAWFRGILERHAGRIQAGGVDNDVAFEETPEPEINDQIDAVYRAKYQRYGERIVGSIISATARAATLRLAPRSN